MRPEIKAVTDDAVRDLLRIVQAAGVDTADEVVRMLETLPMTADGKRVVPGMTVWVQPDGPPGIVRLIHVGRIVEVYRKKIGQAAFVAESLYSTRAAAEAARNKRTNSEKSHTN